MKTSTKTLYRPQFGFSASRKKNKLENIISHHKVKNPDFKTSKKEKQRNPLNRAVIIKKKLKPHMAIG